MSTDSPSSSVPLLPAPSPQSLEDPSVPNVPISAVAPVQLDNLGLMVVNSDGTLLRIANWENRTAEAIAARNRTRLAEQQKDDADSSSAPALSAAASESPS